MKKVLLFAACIAIASVASAQKPASGDMGVTFGVTGINIITVNTTPSNTGSLVFKYLIADDMSARIGLNLGTSKESTESTTTGVKTTHEEDLTSWGLNLGVSKHFEGTDRLDPYFGADIIFTRGGGGTITDRTETVAEAESPDGTDVNGDYDQTVTELGASTTFGLIPHVGFNYFIAEKLALGAEFGWGFARTATAEGKTTTSHSNGGTVTTDPEVNTGTSKTSGFGTAGSGSVTMSFFF